MAGLEQEIDRLYTLPLAEFTPARNALASSLKRAGNTKESERVKTLSKPSASAWAVNQLFWKHRKNFDRLIKAGEELRQAQAAQIAGKSADARKAGEARQEIIAELLRLATEILRNAGHNPSPDIIRRIGTTLEALSAYATLPEPAPGRLTEDVQAPGFDALSALFSGSIPKHVSADSKATKAPERDAEKNRSSEMAAAQAELSQAQHALREAETKARNLESRLKKAAEELEEAEKRHTAAEERFREVSREAKDAALAITNAKRDVERAEKKRNAM